MLKRTDLYSVEDQAIKIWVLLYKTMLHKNIVVIHMAMLYYNL